jgi:hypothetical protein
MVELHMSAGGRIRGIVRDQSGGPLRGVVVQTRVNGLMENAIGIMLGSMIPKKITEMSVQTDAEGRYRFDVMAQGAYQLQFTHPDFCHEVRNDVIVEQGTTTEAPLVALIRGTLVTGTTMVDGVATGQIKVSILVAPSEPGNATPGGFAAEAVSDNLGQYVISKRLPPGTYQIRATRNSDNPFRSFADYQKTQRSFSVGLGQTQVAVDINVPSR